MTKNGLSGKIAKTEPECCKKLDTLTIYFIVEEI
jgi:hypothetical protein